MLYQLVKIWVRLGLHFFCVDIKFNRTDVLQTKSPLLITANHPNSFLDALLFGAFCKHPVLFLARGDAFKNSFLRYLMSLVNMFPIYRLSEGKENLGLNDATFQKSVEVLENNGIVLIFIEGLCVNEWHLRNFKKGTARIALYCKEKNIPLNILPAGINYSSFKNFGKKIFLEFEELISVNQISSTNHQATWLTDFNKKLTKKIKPLVWHNHNKFSKLEIENKFLRAQTFQEISTTASQKEKKTNFQFASLIILYILNGLLYFPLKKGVQLLVKQTVHYDSVFVACLMLMYPLYIFLISIIVYYFFSNIFSSVFVFFGIPIISYLLIIKVKINGN